MNNTGPITKNGVHPITFERVHVKGTAGASAASTPQAGQVAAEGAKNTGEAARKLPAGKPVTGAVNANQMAETLYPTKLGLRGKPV